MICYKAGSTKTTSHPLELGSRDTHPCIHHHLLSLTTLTGIHFAVLVGQTIKHLIQPQAEAQKAQQSTSPPCPHSSAFSQKDSPSNNALPITKRAIRVAVKSISSVFHCNVSTANMRVLPVIIVKNRPDRK